MERYSKGSERRLTLNIPMVNIPHRISFFFSGTLTRKRRGMGRLMIIKSEDTFKTTFVIRWCVAAEHCVVVGTAQ